MTTMTMSTVTRHESTNVQYIYKTDRVIWSQLIAVNEQMYNSSQFKTVQYRALPE